ncbi:MAG: hypothetical protein QM734_10010 [Cyclobacteriaceae bacterium]
MKKIALLVIICTFSQISFAQTREQTMEKRAREFHRQLTLSDKEQWKKFVEENYAQSLIERPMKSKMSRQENDDVSVKEDNIKGTVEDKVKMFERLHNDFGGSKVTSLKTAGDQVEMLVDGSGLNGTFRLTFGKEKPYLLEGLGIDVQGGPRN